MPGDPATDLRLRQLTRSMLAHGYSAWEAPRRALAALELMVERQASLLSYLDAFRLIALIALGCVPIILFAGRPKSAARSAAEVGAGAH